MSQPENRLQGRSIYTSTSMLRVFKPGDLVETDDTVPFEELRVGDIIVFPSLENPEKRIIHRIVRRRGDSLTTMGDNNPAPDKAPVTAAQKPSLAVARILSNGRRLPLSRGRHGMFQFRMNRSRYWLRRCLRRLCRGVEPLMFWRRTLTETRTFGDSVFYYVGNRPVAKLTEKGVRFLKPHWRLLYIIRYNKE